MPEQELGTVFTLSRRLGVFLLSDRLELSPQAVVLFVVIFCSIIGFHVLAVFYKDVFIVGTPSKVSYVIGNALETGISIVSLRSVIEVILRRSELKKSIIKLKSLGPLRRHNRHIYTTTSAFLAIIITDFFVFKPYTSLIDARVFLNFYISWYIILLIESQFIYLLDLVKDRYDVATRSVSSVRSEEGLRRLLDDLKTINKICSLVNAVYTVPLALIVSGLFWVFIAHTYYIILSLLKLGKQLDSQEVEFTLLSIVIFASTTCLAAYEQWKLAWMCNTTILKAQDIKNHLYRTCLEKDEYFWNSVWLKLYIQTVQDPTFTAFRWFNIDLSVLLEMLGRATTYLVVLMQFHLSQI